MGTTNNLHRESRIGVIVLSKQDYPFEIWFVLAKEMLARIQHVGLVVPTAHFVLSIGGWRCRFREDIDASGSALLFEP